MASAEERPQNPIDYIRVTEAYFREKGIDAPRLTAEVLLAHVLKVERIGLYLQYDKPLVRREVDAFRELVRRCARGEPVAYVLGVREFWSLEFEVDSNVLIPRPDTELLVELALKHMPPEGSFLELGLGSGAVSVALLTELPKATAAGVELMPGAAAVAGKNAARHGVADRLEILEGDLFAPVEGRKFDIIISNPPYIPTAEMKTLEVAKTEPAKALDGGPDGLDVIRRIAARAHLFLKDSPSSRLILEYGFGQGEAVAGIFNDSGKYGRLELKPDYAGKLRAIVAGLY